ncbi:MULTISPECIES: type IV toxin-antitoxin system AbiEi family antitoxin domain-containing protein [unclassified Brevibacterium]|uniref:type IV toxin-antitoxin system AbiEi family antitoxin domain-containing protein n=1 Tax=unclassified Brevibacterium TaxID=2614124 RepID=UPI0010F6428D|nr:MULTISPECIES: type IV toxin-antitoxin system AbiEi family antitoxin domain-containing protein [unclassified Brevibacterium]MCM1011738.1 type IV toxin-antitoxin system AbiEi family antitoxin domain-containing protein [Brevibacterium sp. XM4083]
MAQAVVDVLELAAEQQGLLTTHQAQRRGISRLALSRLAGQGIIERVSHGVYATLEGATGPHIELIAAWLSLEPERFAHERLGAGPEGFTVTHRSAAELMGLGQMVPDKLEFVSTRRKRTGLQQVRLRRRSIGNDDIAIIAGLPCTTVERTIADLVESREDLSLVSDVVADAEPGSIDFEKLSDLLEPLARRNGRESGSDLLRLLISGSRREAELLEAARLTSLSADRDSSRITAAGPK